MTYVNPAVRYFTVTLALAASALSLPALGADPGLLAAREARHVAATFPGRMAGTPMEDATANYIE